ncbi:hypothetical protein [uncultured Tateyamaria sp.]|uniref:hypothetical protein n=1 Tax=uncultured Tateyamaria sp. TaxID=455651 RepID=UPI0026122946|nr:hypothetical protein [uncultured Tateyamaria sp.]
MKLKASVLAACLLVAGCDYAEVTQAPVEVSMKTSGRQVLGFTEPTMRTFVRKDGNQSEVVGARCTFDSAELTGSAVTPAIVRMPIFKGQPTALRVDCKAPGLSGKQTVNPVLNGTAVGAASPAGLVVGLVTASIVAAQDKWSYGANNSIMTINMDQAE